MSEAYPLKNYVSSFIFQLFFSLFGCDGNSLLEQVRHEYVKLTSA